MPFELASSPFPSLFGFSLLSCVASCSICLWSGSCSFTALGLLSNKEGALDALCQVILSLGKSAPGYGKMAFTCLCTGSDGWLPICVAAVTAQGLPFLVLSETYSWPNEQHTSGLNCVYTTSYKGPRLKPAHAQ